MQSAVCEMLEARTLFTTYVVNTLRDNLADLTGSDGRLSLREAIVAANSDTAVGDAEAGSGADTIVFAQNLTGGTIYLGGSALDVTSTMTIDGGTRRVTINARNLSRVFEVLSTSDVNINRLTVSNGQAGGGGAMYFAGGGSARLDDVTIRNSVATGDAAGIGAGIWSDGFDLTVANSRILNNRVRTEANGAGIATSGVGSTVLFNTVIRGNVAEGGSGGGVYHTGTDMLIDRCTIDSNTAGGGAGGVYSNTQLFVSGTLIKSNRTVSGGGAGLYLSGIATITASQITDNRAAHAGGGGIAGGNTIRIYDSELLRNSADVGGGIYTGGTLILERVNVANNSAGTGGGIHLFGHAEITDCTFTANTATARSGDGGNVLVGVGFLGDGGAINLQFATALITDTDFIANSAAGVAGAVANKYLYRRLSTPLPGFLQINGGRVLRNRGGGIYSHSDMVLSEVVIRDNIGAGVVYSTSPFSTTIDPSVVAENNTGGNILGWQIGIF